MVTCSGSGRKCGTYWSDHTPLLQPSTYRPEEGGHISPHYSPLCACVFPGRKRRRSTEADNQERFSLKTQPRLHEFTAENVEDILSEKLMYDVSQL